MSTGIVIFAHGSSIHSANEAVRAVTKAAARAGRLERVEVAFLEPHHPNLGETVGRLADAGISRVLIVPYFLTLGLHLRRDLPGIVEQLSFIHKNIEIRVTPPLDGHPGLADIVVDRARDALAEWR